MTRLHGMARLFARRKVQSTFVRAAKSLFSDFYSSLYKVRIRDRNCEVGITFVRLTSFRALLRDRNAIVLTDKMRKRKETHKTEGKKKQNGKTCPGLRYIVDQSITKYSGSYLKFGLRNVDLSSVDEFYDELEIIEAHILGHNDCRMFAGI